MKRFKQLDFCVSLLFIVIFFVLSIIRDVETVLIGYFVVGGWQVTSMIIHGVKGWFTNKNSVRYKYHWVVGGIIFLGLSGLINTFFLGLLAYPMLLAAPVMAIYYTWLCFDETFIKMQQRPIALLK